MALVPGRVSGYLAIVIFVVLLVGGIFYGIEWANGQSSPDRQLSALGVVAGWEAVLLAVFGGLIALLAFIQTTRGPNLALDVAAQITMSTVMKGPYKHVAEHPDNSLRMTLVGRNDVSARNPAVRVTIKQGLSFLQGRLVVEAGWSELKTGTSDLKAAQWDGGANYLVHGKWTRSLPPLPLGDSRLTNNEITQATLNIEWVADGIRQRSKSVTVNLE